MRPQALTPASQGSASPTDPVFASLPEVSEAVDEARIATSPGLTVTPGHAHTVEGQAGGQTLGPTQTGSGFPDVVQGYARPNLGAVLQSFTGVFLVLGQNYQPETVSVRLRVGCSVADALDTLHSRRRAQAAACLPRLIVVHPQPRGDHALVIGMPSWPCDGAMIAYDCREIDGRLFSLCIGSRASKTDLLIAAGLDEDLDCSIYVKDQPWALEHDAVTALAHGDLIQVTPRTARHHVVSSLAAMLLSIVGWDPYYTFPGPRREAAWILAPDTFALVEATERRHLDAAAIASRIHIPESVLALRPARPAVCDFAHRGSAVHNVVIAASLQSMRPGDDLTVPVCFLDCRPLLSRVDWYPCPNGVFQSEAFVAALRPRCPPGYDVGLIHRGIVLAPILSRIQITDRETLIFTFYEVPDPAPGNVGPGDDPPGPPDQPSDDHAPPDRPSEHRLRTGGTTTTTDAGTGSTAAGEVDGQLPRQQIRAHTAWVSEICMWRTGLTYHDAAVAGRLSLTPASSLFAPEPGSIIRRHRSNHTLRLIQELAICCLFCGSLCVSMFWIAVSILMIIGKPPPAPLWLGLRLALLCCLHSAAGVQAVQLTPMHAAPFPADTQHWAGPITHPPTHEVAKADETGQLVPDAEALPVNTVCPARRLPTPCRNARDLPHITGRSSLDEPPADRPFYPSHGADPWPELRDIVTLLEEAACVSDEWAFLASTLLDTLLDFYGSVCPAESCTMVVRDEKLLRPILHLDLACPPPEPPPCTLGARIRPVGIRDGASWDYGGREQVHQRHTLAGLELPVTPQDLLLLFSSAPPLLIYEQAKVNADAAALLDGEGFSQVGVSPGPASNIRHILCYTDGSFYPPDTAKPAAAGWACVFLEPGVGGFNCAYGSFPAWLAAPTEELSAYLGECAALVFAGLVATARFRHVPVTFLSDCQAALGILSGRHSFSTGGCPQALRHVFELRRQLASLYSCPDSFEYVPGHKGHFANELADKLSKHGALHGPSCHDAGVLCKWLSNGAPWLPWAATILAPAFAAFPGAAPALPLDCHPDPSPCDHDGMTPADIIAPFVPLGVMDAHNVDDPEEHMHLHLRLLSFNTLSLGAAQDKGPEAGEGLSCGPARAALLADQLAAAGITVAALQETRGAQGSFRVGHFLRYAGGSTRGQFGTEWWFRDGAPIVTSAHPDKTYRFEASALTTVHEDNRRLFIRYSRRGLSMLFVSVHAPHRATEQHILEEWWHTTLDLVFKHRRQDKIVLAGDFNCALGSVVSSHVGPVGAETEDIPGAFAHRALRAAECWAPATFDHCHFGATTTYVQKRNGHPCRVDFVCIPQAWTAANVRSELAPGINAAHATIDHTAVLVDCQVVLALPGSAPRVKARKFSAEIVTDPQNHEALRQAILAAPQVPWHISAHARAALVTQHMQQCLTRLQTAPRTRPWHAYLQAETWQLQQAVTKLRRDLHRLKHQVSLQLRAVCFQCWRGGPTVPEVLATSAWFCRADLAEAWYKQQLDYQCRQLRHACPHDRDAYVSGLAQKIATCPSPEVFQAVHKILQHRRKKPYQAEPLPMIRQLDGSVCPDTASAQKRWREHFGGLEAGIESTPQALASKAMSNSADSWPQPLSLDSIPDVTALQRVLSSSKLHKAPGPDGIPAELGKTFPVEIADLLPLLLKFVLRGEEAVGHKVGEAIFFWKGKGSHQDCGAYRAILLLNAWAKAIHQAIRPRALQLYHASAPPLQLGSRAGKKCGVRITPG